MRIEHYVKLVAAQVPLCPLPLVEMETRNAVRDFLKRSKAWTEVVEGEWDDSAAFCLMHLPEGTEIAHVYEVRVDGHDVEHIAGEREFWPDTAFHSAGGPSKWRLTNGFLCLYPCHTGKDAELVRKVEALVALSLNGLSRDVPDWIEPDVISYGAMSRLYAMAGQTWSNAALGAVFEEKFGQAIAEKRIERSHGGKPGTLTMQAPFVGGYF